LADDGPCKDEVETHGDEAEDHSGDGSTSEIVISWQAPLLAKPKRANYLGLLGALLPQIEFVGTFG